MKIYKCYPTGGFAPTLENFWETCFYSTGKYYDYNGRESIFDETEVLILWTPLELEYGKFVPNRYFGKIKNMGIVEFKYCPKNDEIILINFEKIIRWKSLNDEEKSRLKKCLYRQCCYQEQQNFWSINTLNVYIEVYRPILQEQDQFFKQKILHNVAFDFDEEWSLRKKSEKNNRFFRISEGIFYDLERKIFIKNGEEILFSPYNYKKKQKFLEILINSACSNIPKETLLEILKIDNKALLDLKRSFLTFEFGKYLWLDKRWVEKNILIAEKNKWYKIIWEFCNKNNP